MECSGLSLHGYGLLLFCSFASRTTHRQSLSGVENPNNGLQKDCKIGIRQRVDELRETMSFKTTKYAMQEWADKRQDFDLIATG